MHREFGTNPDAVQATFLYTLQLYKDTALVQVLQASITGTYII